MAQVSCDCPHVVWLQRWRGVLRKLVPVFFSPQEMRAIQANLASDPGWDTEAEVTPEDNPLTLARYFKHFLERPPPEVDEDWAKRLDRRLNDSWIYETEEVRRGDSRFPEYNTNSNKEATVVDMSQALEFLPREDNLYSLGRDGSTRVRRITAGLTDIGLENFPSFWSSNKSGILASVSEHLLQRATQESDTATRADSYVRQRDFLASLAKGIASARGVTVDIVLGVRGAEDIVYEGGYYRRPDSFIRIGEAWASVEQKTRGGNARKIPEARGQVVVLGNMLFRKKSRYVPIRSLWNQVYGFVGDGVQLQCVRQVHAYKEKVTAYDGPLLPLAPGEHQAGETFTINTNSDAVVWAAAALDRMVVSEARRLQAGAGMSNDRYLGGYGQLKLMATSGYRIGGEYLRIPGNAPVDHFEVTLLGAARNNDMSVVLRVLWKGEVWWLKLGAEAETRQKALQAPDELPTGGWERWFQTERDMLSRALLGKRSSEAFAVVVEAGRNRPAMLVKDAGDSLEKRLLATQVMQPAQVHEMSKQLYTALEASGKQGVIHGDVCLENICEKNGLYSLIDWGLASGRPFEDLAAAVGKAWPGLDVMNQTPGIPNWEMSADCCFLGVRPYSTEHDLESVLYCCMKLLGGNVLPWSDAAVSGSELDVLNLRAATVNSFVKTQGRYIHGPLLLKLGLISAQESAGNNIREEPHDLQLASSADFHVKTDLA